MEGVDKEKVQRVIYEMSKGSKYFENEQKKEAITKLKIEHLRAQCAKLTDNDISHFQKVRAVSVCAKLLCWLFLPPSRNIRCIYNLLTHSSVLFVITSYTSSIHVSCFTHVILFFSFYAVMLMH
jgi:hypothetical protein